MKRTSGAAVAVFVLATLVPAAAFAQLKVIISGGFSPAYRQLLPEFERTSGITVTTTTGGSIGPGPNTIGGQIRRGVPADVVILAREGLSELIAEKRIVSGTDVDLAQSVIGMIVRAGAPRPDISTVEAFKQTMLRAKSVAMSSSTSGTHLTTKVFPQLGIAAEMAAKSSSSGAAAVGRGEAEIGLQQVSEVLAVQGVDFVGAIPAEIQYVTVYAAGIVAGSKEIDAAKKLIAFLSSAGAADAIKKSGMEPSAPARSQAVNIWPGVAPGSESWTYKEGVATDTPLGTVVWNIVTPTLTPYLPDRTKATGTAVVVAPGGAFVALAIDQAHDVARWLQERGIAAFVLKYRIPEKRGDGIPAGMDQDEAGKYGIADGIQALNLVRQRAAEWGLFADRIGFLGFSAGAMVASGALLQQAVDARPSFAALLYGGPFGVMPPIPSKLPPIFMAWAQDDNVALGLIVRFYSALTAAGHKPEAHIFNAGGHGFGMKPQGTSSDHWIEALYSWLEGQGLTRQKPKA